MKNFEDYVDGEWVCYTNNYHDDSYRYQAYKSKFTYNAFRLKNSYGEKIADITEITPIGGRYEEFNRDIQSSPRSSDYDFYRPHVDSDADASGIYHVQD